jgi:hypothetical protein
MRSTWNWVVAVDLDEGRIGLIAALGSCYRGPVCSAYRGRNWIGIALQLARKAEYLGIMHE